jgi:hypothetical protein
MVIDTCYLTMIVVGWESDTEFTMSRQNISMSLDMCLSYRFSKVRSQCDGTLPVDIVNLHCPTTSI